MELLPAVTAWLDSRTRVLKKQVTDLVTDPVGHVEKQAFNALEDTSNFIDKSREDPMAWVEGLAGNGMVGTFIGKGAKAWNPILAEEAVKLKAAGISPEGIWRKTGTWTEHPDGQLRQEISDHAASLDPKGFERIGTTALSRAPTLEGILKHPDLYSAYPGLPKIPTSVGMAEGMSRKGLLSKRGISVISNSDEDATNILLHELQHAVQHKEGFAPGGAASDIKNFPRLEFALQAEIRKLRKYYGPNEPQDYLDMIASRNLYARLAGEAEARATQARQHLTPEDRLLKYPADSYDIPIESLLIR